MLYSGMSWNLTLWRNVSVWVMMFWLWVITPVTISPEGLFFVLPYGTTFLTFATHRIQNELRGFLHSIRMAYMENYYPDDEDGEGDWAEEELCFLACQELRPLEKMFLNERRDLLLDASMDACRNWNVNT